MLIGCWSPKGGSGVTVFVAACALVASANTDVVLVDTDGDVASALGVAEPTRGWRDLLVADELPVGAIARIAVDVSPSVRLVGPGSSSVRSMRRPDSIEGSVAALRSIGELVFVDLGRAHDADVVALARSLDSLVMVTRPCYLAYRRALNHELTSQSVGAVVLQEPGRTLTSRDLTATVGLQVVARIAVRPDICRAVDSGTIAYRVPESLARGVRATLAAVRATTIRSAA